jgi:hypothetical protein
MKLKTIKIIQKTEKYNFQFLNEKTPVSFS